MKIPVRLLYALACLTSLVSGCSSGTPSSSSSGTPPPTSPDITPAITSVNPAKLGAGAPGITLTVTGSGFLSSTTIEVAGVVESTAFISSTQISASVPASQLASGAVLNVIANNGSASSASGAAVNLEVDNPVPTITQFAPSTFASGSVGGTISVTGTGFVPTTVVQVNGIVRPTVFVSATQVNVAVTSADVALAGGLSLMAVNPSPAGGTSATASVPVNNPVPGAIILMPSSLPSGVSTATAVVVTGSNFLPSSTVQVGNSTRATTYVSPTELSFQLTVADQATAGRFAVSVVTPSPGGGTSPVSYITLVVSTQTPVLAQVSPNQFIAGSAQTTVAATGSNITANTVILWNGAPIATAYITNPSYGSYLVGTVSASLLASAGTASITLSSPDAAVPISNPLPVTLTNPPPPTLTSLSSTLAPVNTTTNLALYGTGFTPTSTVALDGVTIPSTYSPDQIMASIPSSAVLTPGVYAVTISNAAGTTAPLYVTAYVPIDNNSMIYNPVNGLFYLSVPSAAGAPYGNSIVSVDPVTGVLGTPIPVGSEPNRMAITSDGRYLWVALDGSSSVRKVDLTADAAGLQFSIGNTYTVSALAALPGQTDSVVISTYYGGYTTPTGVSLAIYDSGTPRASIVTFATYAPFPYALIVDGTRNEIYGPGDVLNWSNNYNTYSYSSAGVTLKEATLSSLNFGSNNSDDVELSGGRLYTSLGQAVDPETGALLGTFYSSGTTTVQGSIAVDPSLGKAFILPGDSGDTGTTPISVFNTSDYSFVGATPFSVSIPVFRADYQFAGPTGLRLTRWGSNGLAFHGTGGFVSVHSSLVQDISALTADIGVTLTVSGTNSTGSATTYIGTITNNGPSAASNVELTAFLPSSGNLISVTPSAGTCSTSGTVLCDLGGLSGASSVTVVFQVLQMTAGSATMTVQASASETDPVSSNNQATSTLTVTGNPYYATPTLSAITPSVIASGSNDTTISVTGTGFNSGSTVLLNGTALTTTFDSSSTLTAIVPAASLAQLGWAAISVSTAPPGGGTSSSIPLSIYSVLSLGANHIVYDPYTRKIMAGIGAGTSVVAGNSILAITPDTASFGSPVAIGGTPTVLSLTSDGQILYALVPSASTGSIARFNMLTQQPDFTVAGFEATGYNVGLRDITTQPGTENTIAVDEGEYPGISIFDFNPTAKTATRRGAATGIYTGTCLAFPNDSNLFATDLYTSGGGLADYSVTSNGLLNGSYPYYTGTGLQYTNCYKLNGGFLYAEAGGVADITTTPPLQTGTFEDAPQAETYGAPAKDFEADTSLGTAFYFSTDYQYSSTRDGITAFSTKTFLPIGNIPIPFSTLEPTNGFTGVDMVRWGQDGLAVLSASGQLYLVRGAVIVPQLLASNSAALLSGASSFSATAGSGNLLLTLTGTNFVPGVAALWNGDYRMTTIVDSTHLTIAIPASDLSQIGVASITVKNPGAAPSNAISFTIN